MRMKLSDFNYDLPKELVAEYPNKKAMLKMIKVVMEQIDIM